MLGGELLDVLIEFLPEVICVICMVIYYIIQSKFEKISSRQKKVLTSILIVIPIFIVALHSLFELTDTLYDKIITIAIILISNGFLIILYRRISRNKLCGILFFSLYNIIIFVSIMFINKHLLVSITYIFNISFMIINTRYLYKSNMTEFHLYNMAGIVLTIGLMICFYPHMVENKQELFTRKYLMDVMKYTQQDIREISSLTYPKGNSLKRVYVNLRGEGLVFEYKSNKVLPE